MGSIVVPGSGDLARTADVVIIGGGVIGCATAFYVSSSGLATVVLERRDALGTLTTAASEECFRAQFDETENIRMMLESITVFEAFADVVGIAGYNLSLHQQGYLFLTDEPGALTVQQRVAHQRRQGLHDVEFLDAQQVRQTFAFIGDEVHGAAYRAKDGWLSAHELVSGFAKGSRAFFALQTPATGIRLDTQGVCAVETPRGEIQTRCVVIAAGPFSSVVGAQAGAKLPLTAIRRQKVVLRDTAGIPQHAPMTIDLASGAYWRPETGGAALGLALPEEPSPPTERVPTDWTFPAIVLDAVGRLVPFWSGVAARLTRDQVFLSAGQYTCTPDLKPIIGPVPDVPGLFVNSGYSGHGIMASPAGARMLADSILHVDATLHNPFRPDRFTELGTQISAERLVL